MRATHWSRACIFYLFLLLILLFLCLLLLILLFLFLLLLPRLLRVRTYPPVISFSFPP